MELILNAFLSKTGTLELTPISKCCCLFILYPRNLSNRIDLLLRISPNVPNAFDLSGFSSLGLLKVKVVSPDQINDFNAAANQPILRCTERRLVWIGFASVIRALVNISCTEDCSMARRLLGLHKACLKACKEVSKWTCFCEQTLPQQLAHAICSNDETDPPCFEQMRQTFHLDAPIPNKNKRLHNRKKKQNQDKTVAESGSEEENLKTPDVVTVKREKNEFDSRLPNTHRYLEGPRKTLVDIVSGFFITEAASYSDRLHQQAHAIPELRQWFFYLSKDVEYLESCKKLSAIPINWRSALTQFETNESMYNADAFSSIVLGIEKMKVVGAITKELTSAVETASSLAWPCDDVENLLGNSWSNLPPYVNPREGQVPESRLQRKCEQLTSIVSAVLPLVKPGATLVDFCCGGGHVGLLLAHLLPTCRVILLENKEESLVRAEARVAASNGRLSNVFLYKCNLTDFRSSQFDVGVALHACGTATDLVMDACAAAGASFVISPCCYGAIKPNAIVGRFPRSEAFRAQLGDLEAAQSLFARLSHGADITDREHVLWDAARQAMRLVDSDRMWRAKESASFEELHFKRMIPEGCSPKDHLLIGQAKA